MTISYYNLHLSLYQKWLFQEIIISLYYLHIHGILKLFELSFKKHFS